MYAETTNPWYWTSNDNKHVGLNIVIELHELHLDHVSFMSCTILWYSREACLHKYLIVSHAGHNARECKNSCDVIFWLLNGTTLLGLLLHFKSL